MFGYQVGARFGIFCTLEVLKYNCVVRYGRLHFPKISTQISLILHVFLQYELAIPPNKQVA